MEKPTIKIDDHFEKQILKEQLDLAQCGMSGVRVAACLIAVNNENKIKSFYGSNIEIARGRIYHAEETVLVKAISEGYVKPACIILTANNPKYLVPLCYACRAIYAYVEPQCLVLVLNEKMEDVVMTTVHDSMKYHYESKGFIS